MGLSSFIPENGQFYKYHIILIFHINIFDKRILFYQSGGPIIGVCNIFLRRMKTLWPVRGLGHPLYGLEQIYIR